MSIELKPVGILQGCYPQKFGTPRQSGLAPAAKAYIDLLPPYYDANFFAGLEQFSHLWLIFQFHQHKDKTAQAQVRPPRLGGNDKQGVFATRSSFRPNHLGLSVVKLEGTEFGKQVGRIYISGIDMINGTPILDIKPYIPYSDAIADASGGFANSKPPQSKVRFQQKVLDHLSNNAELKQLIEETLQQDPRPAYHNDEREYGLSLLQYNIRWKPSRGEILVLAIEEI